MYWSKLLKAKIIGTGKYVPERVLTNADLEKMVDTSDEWIVSRTGMRERRIAKSDEFTSTMGAHAARRALASAEMDISAIDLIICGTLSPDYQFPSTASLIQDALGAECGAFDFGAACSGYVYGLASAKAFIESGMYKNILFIAAEKLSSVVDYEDRNTCVLFGDGASACVVSGESRPGLLIRDCCLGSDGSLGNVLNLPAGGCREPASAATVQAKKHYLTMNGREVFKHAVRRMESACEQCLEKTGIAQSEITWLVPHQANIRIIDAVARRFDVPSEKVFTNVEKYGNTSAASVGIALDELLSDNLIKEGENILLTAFGAGLTWGSTILTKEGT